MPFYLLQLLSNKHSIRIALACGFLLAWLSIPWAGALAQAPDRTGDSSALPQAGKNGISNPACVSCPAPQYDKRAPAKKKQGVVLLRATVTVEGTVKDISVVKSLSPELDQKAIEIVQKWRLKPAKGRDGKPVAAQTEIEITFRLL